jgi:hypothetical protein
LYIISVESETVNKTEEFKMIKIRGCEVSKIEKAYYLGHVVDGRVGCVMVSKEVAREELKMQHGFMQHLTIAEVEEIRKQGVVFEGVCPKDNITSEELEKRIFLLCNEGCVDSEKTDKTPYQKGDEF